MARIGDLYQTADWKTEKHVPVIECRDEVAADEMFEISISLGKEVAHPNTTEHNIRWIRLYFKPDGEKFSYEIGSYEFSAHGESVEGPNTGPAYTNHSVVTKLKLKKSGNLLATAFCNIHGLWENTKPITVR
ncbi:MAG: class II SORL domain-containing protein [Desulfomonile tiedjei]|uniref:Class II SORL domain-containing protein n=1 Tax=Desulfomonile tiedjei TaxID=2358 RepID=A0A9D6VA16_9BACT|nr:class II SORL domain-containing protein [Desulfomonile tiedjei]